jgi:hypothetical protein
MHYTEHDSLAYHEMRLVLASVLLCFDLELCDEAEDWLDQDVYILWEKEPLHVKLFGFFEGELGFQSVRHQGKAQVAT